MITTVSIYDYVNVCINGYVGEISSSTVIDDQHFRHSASTFGDDDASTLNSGLCYLNNK
jgi:hypothetical protein